MSAQEFRQAADVERREWGGEQNARQYPTSAAIHLALADVLESLADCIDRSPDEDWDVIFALEYRLARLINGGAS